MHTFPVRWSLLCGLLVVLCAVTACDLNWGSRKLTARQRHKQDVPLGWTLIRGRAQMIARSYSGERWLNLMLRLEGKPRRLFRVKVVRLPSVMDVVRLFQGTRQPNSLPNLKGRAAPKKKKRQLAGLSFLFRNAETLPLEVRLLQVQGKGKSRRVLTFTQRLLVKPTVGRWTRRVIRFRDFRLLGKPQSKVRAEPRLSSGFEFWEKTPPGWKAESRSVTIMGPTLWTRKRVKRPSTRPVKRK